MACLRPGEKDVHLFLCVCACMLMCVHVYMCACVWRPKDNARSHSSVDALIVFKTGFLTGLGLRVRPGICTPPPPQIQSQHTPASHGVGTQLRPRLLLSVNTADDL